jgi:two-component system CheB/CheR fusion protein
MLQQMTARLREKRTFESAIGVVLDDVIALHGAEFGDFQLPVRDELVIVAQRGLTRPFLDAFRRVKQIDGCACGRALHAGKPVVVRDVRQDKAYAPFRRIAKSAGYRSVQSTPLFTEGLLLGVVSTLFASPHEPTAIEMKTLEDYGVVASAYLLKLLAGKSLSEKAVEMNNRLYASATA